jgi:hypothetical protein
MLSFICQLPLFIFIFDSCEYFRVNKPFIGQVVNLEQDQKMFINVLVKGFDFLVPPSGGLKIASLHL